MEEKRGVGEGIGFFREFGFSVCEGSLMTFEYFFSSLFSFSRKDGNGLRVRGEEMRFPASSSSSTRFLFVLRRCSGSKCVFSRTGRNGHGSDYTGNKIDKTRAIFVFFFLFL